MFRACREVLSCTTVIVSTIHTASMVLTLLVFKISRGTGSMTSPGNPLQCSPWGSFEQGIPSDTWTLGINTLCPANSWLNPRYPVSRGGYYLLMLSVDVLWVIYLSRKFSWSISPASGSLQQWQSLCSLLYRKSQHQRDVLPRIGKTGCSSNCFQ